MRALAVRIEAAKAAVAASKKTGRPVDPRVAKLASRMGVSHGPWNMTASGLTEDKTYREPT